MWSACKQHFFHAQASLQTWVSTFLQAVNGFKKDASEDVCMDQKENQWSRIPSRHLQLLYWEHLMKKIALWSLFSSNWSILISLLLFTYHMDDCCASPHHCTAFAFIELFCMTYKLISEIAATMHRGLKQSLLIMSLLILFHGICAWTHSAHTVGVL